MRKLFFLILLSFLSFLLTSPALAIRIGLIEGVRETAVAVSSAGSIYDVSGRELMKLQPMNAYVFKNSRKSIQVKINGKFYPLNSKKIIIKTADPKGFVLAKKRWYRQDLEIFKGERGLTVVNNINLELYLLGVVPSEMPPSWHLEAHKAQAIAARSYALANLGKRGSRGFDLLDTPDDQAYGGATSETAKTNKAVIDTKGQILMNNNKVISAYYCASAGGRTKNSGKVWDKNLPYLHSVPSFDKNVPKNGHGVGMSQHGANNLANKGYSAYQILAHFYKNVYLSTTSAK